MKKKFKTIAAISVCGCLILGGCSTTATDTSGSAQSQAAYADEEFIQSLSDGLEARWKLDSKYRAKHDGYEPDYGTDEHIDLYTSSVEAELTEISQYKNADFKDAALKGKAAEYIQAVEDQKEAIKYINVDDLEYNELWNDAYDRRSKLIDDFVTTYGLTVSESGQSNLDDLQNNATLVKKDESKEQAIQDMLSAAKFELVENIDGWKTYEAVIENTTGIDIADLTVNINLLDEDGVIVSTEYDEVSSFKQGQKAKITVMTDQSFETAEITTDYWEEE